LSQEQGGSCKKGCPQTCHEGARSTKNQGFQELGTECDRKSVPYHKQETDKTGT